MSYIVFSNRCELKKVPTKGDGYRICHRDDLLSLVRSDVLEREVAFLTVHSMLHLLGYDHEKSPLEQRQMREKEESVLEKLGFSRDTSYIVPDEQE